MLWLWEEDGGGDVYRGSTGMLTAVKKAGGSGGDQRQIFKIHINSKNKFPANASSPAVLRK